MKRSSNHKSSSLIPIIAQGIYMSHPMTFKINSGAECEYFSVENIEPLDLESFNHEVTKIKFSGERIKFIGSDKFSYKDDHYIDVKHHSKSNMFVLCSGGWILPSYVLGKNYLVDRNILSYITENKNYEDFLNWFDVIKNSNDIKFSAIFSAIERNSVFIGDEKNYISNVLKDKLELEKYFTNDSSYKFSNNSLSSIYSFVKSRSSENTLKFLIDCVEHLVDKTKESERFNKVKLILGLANKHKVKKK